MAEKFYGDAPRRMSYAEQAELEARRIDQEMNRYMFQKMGSGEYDEPMTGDQATDDRIRAQTAKDLALGVPEAALTVGSSILADIPAGLAGINAIGPEKTRVKETGEDVLSERQLDPVEEIERVQNALTYMPRGKSGQRVLEHLGNAMQTIFEPLTRTNDALLAAGARNDRIPMVTVPLTAITALGEMIPGKKPATAAARAGTRINLLNKNRPNYAQMAEEAAGTIDADFAGTVLKHDQQAGSRAAVLTDRRDAPEGDVPGQPKWDESVPDTGDVLKTQATRNTVTNMDRAATRRKTKEHEELQQQIADVDQWIEESEKMFKDATGWYNQASGNYLVLDPRTGRPSFANEQFLKDVRERAFRNGENPDKYIEELAVLSHRISQAYQRRYQLATNEQKLYNDIHGEPKQIDPPWLGDPKQRGMADPKVLREGGAEILGTQAGRNVATNAAELAAGAPAPQDVSPVNVSTPGAKVGTMARRVGTTGKYRGAPRHIDSPQKLGKLRRDLLASLERGVPGRNWYDRSSQTALDLTAERPNLRDQYVGGIAVTSADTAVPSNAGFAIKAHNQNVLNDPIHTGRYPQRMSENISAINRGDEVMLTDKVGPFYEANKITDLGKDVRPTNDLWMARAFGYTQKDPKTGKWVEWSSGLGEAQHRFMDEEINRIVKIANERKIGGFDDWTPERVQAAIWVDTKARREGTSIEAAATDFATDLNKRTVSIASESTPANSLNHLTGVTSTDEGRQALFDAQNRLLTDDQGRDLVAVHANALTRPSVQGHGIYADDINPVTKTQILGGTETGKQVIDNSSERLGRGIAGAHGMLKGQETVAVKFIRPADEAGLRNALRVEMGQPIDKEKMKSLQKALDEQFGEGQVIADFHENGVDLLAINLDDAGSVAIKPVADRLAAQGSANNALNVKRPAALTKKTNALHESLGLKPKTGTREDGFPDRLPKNWQQEAEQVVLRELDAIDAMDAMDNTATRTGKGPAPGLVGEFGEYKPSAMLEEIDAAGPKFAENIDPLMRWAGKAFEEVDAALSKAIPNAGERNKILRMTREALAEGGLDRVRELVKQGVLPAVVLGVFVSGGQSEPSDPGAA